MDEMKLVGDWLKGLIDWADLPVNVQEAVDEAMIAYVDEAGEDDAASETVEEPFTAEIVKEAGEQLSDANLELLHKADNEHRFTLGPWYIPDRYDAHGEWTDADELQKSLWEYVKSGDRGIRLQHNKDIVAGEWLEAMSFPVPVTIGMTKDANSKQVEYPAGTVFLGVQWKPWAWELVKAGKIQGFSIGGAAARIDMSMPDAIAKASFAGDRSAAGRYAANQRWQGSPAQQRVSDRVASAMGYRGMEMAARLNAARSRKFDREKRGEQIPGLIERLKTYFSEEYTNPKPFSQVEADRYEVDAKRTSRRRGGDIQAVSTPKGDVFLQGGRLFQAKTMGKSIDALKAEMRVTARITDFRKGRAFGGDRSEAGRYAANMRWQNQRIQDEISDLLGNVRPAVTAGGKAAQSVASSLRSHCDFDALAKELKANGVAIDDFETKDGTKVADIVFKYLTPERQQLWKETAATFVSDQIPSAAPGELTVYVKGGGAASGKSTPSPEIMTPLADPSRGEFEAVLVNPDEVKSLLPEYKRLSGTSESRTTAAADDALPGGHKNDTWKDAASFVHEESAMIAQLVTGAAIASGKNVVIDGVCNNGLVKQFAKLDSYREAGADKVVGVFYSASIDNALQRANSRAMKVGREVKADTLISNHKGVSKNFPEYVKSGKFDSISVYDTNGQDANGRPRAVKMFESVAGKSSIIEPALYQDFLDKVSYGEQK
tara:strand:+ start:10925 stop:13072 length:2148 start_codon:yes stop_codon:yes gene_type:complete